MYTNTHICQSVFIQIFTDIFIIILTIHDNGSCGILIFAYNVHQHIHSLFIPYCRLLSPSLTLVSPPLISSPSKILQMRGNI